MAGRRQVKSLGSGSLLGFWTIDRGSISVVPVVYLFLFLGFGKTIIVACGAQI